MTHLVDVVRDPQFLRDPRITRWSAIVLLQYFVAEWVVSATWRGLYSYGEIPTGPLGVPFCGPQGTWPCSALSPVLNVSLVITGAAMVVIGASWALRRRVAWPHATMIAIAGAGLIGAGLVTERVDWSVHALALNTFSMFGALGLLLAGISASTAMAVPTRALLGIVGAVATAAFLCYGAGLTELLGSGWTQRLIIYPILLGLLVVGVVDRSAPDPAPEPSTEPDTQPEPATDHGAGDDPVSDAPRTPDTAVSP